MPGIAKTVRYSRWLIKVTIKTLSLCRPCSQSKSPEWLVGGWNQRSQFVICIIEKRTGDTDIVTHYFKLGCRTLWNERCGEIPPSSSCEIDKPGGNVFSHFTVKHGLQFDAQWIIIVVWFMNQCRMQRAVVSKITYSFCPFLTRLERVEGI